MNFKFFNFLNLAFALYFCSNVFSQPRIVLDSTKYFYGNLTEEKLTSITYTIPVKNSGNEPLKITDVRKSCGCTSLEFDSVIAPGKTGYIRPTLNLKGMTGTISKSITIINNDPSNATIGVRLEAFIFQPLIITPSYIRLPAKNSTVPSKFDLLLLSDTKNIKIKEITFEPLSQTGQETQIASKNPIDISITQKDTTMKNNMYEFIISLSTSITTTETLQGTFIVKTTHTKKPEIKIFGQIDKASDKN